MTSRTDFHFLQLDIQIPDPQIGVEEDTPVDPAPVEGMQMQPRSPAFPTVVNSSTTDPAAVTASAA
jgi:hypothetical protein